MDRFAKTSLVVIAACLLVIANDKINFLTKAHAEFGAAGSDNGNGKLAIVGGGEKKVYFLTERNEVIICEDWKCKKAGIR